MTSLGFVTRCHFSEATELYQHWPGLEPEEKRQIVEAITEKIVVGKEAISVSLYYVPSCKEVEKGWRKGEDSNLR